MAVRVAALPGRSTGADGVTAMDVDLVDLARHNEQHPGSFSSHAIRPSNAIQSSWNRVSSHRYREHHSPRESRTGSGTEVNI
jgi:hypothetical protein